jgi:hypothetical protein
MSLRKRFHLFWKVLPVVAALALLKDGVRWLGWDFIPLDGLIPSLIAGAIFLIGFLLSQVLADYREAERMPADIRAALESIHDDVLSFAMQKPGVGLSAFRKALIGIVEAFEAGVGMAAHHKALEAAEAKVDALSVLYAQLQALDISERYLVRLKSAQDTLRRSLYRIDYIQKIQFVPSVHVLVRSLVAASLFVLLFLKTSGAWEAMLILVFVGYMFVYSLLLIGHLDQPFRQGEETVDDVSLYQLRQFMEKMGAAGDIDAAAVADALGRDKVPAA